MNPPHTLRWRKSTRSADGQSDQCVEMATEPGLFAIRDSKKPVANQRLLLPDTARMALLAHVR